MSDRDSSSDKLILLSRIERLTLWMLLVKDLAWQQKALAHEREYPPDGEDGLSSFDLEMMAQDLENQERLMEKLMPEFATGAAQEARNE